MEALWIYIAMFSIAGNIFQFAIARNKKKDQIEWFDMFLREFQEKQWWRNKAKERDDRP